MDTYTVALLKIVKDQEAVVGPLAKELARTVEGVKWVDDKPTIIGEGESAIRNLVKLYSSLFGQASIDVCKDSVESIDTDLSHKLFS